MEESLRIMDSLCAGKLESAWVRFDPGDTIRVYGSSDEFGGCDKNIAADLLNSVFPNKKILIRHSQGCRVKVFAGNIRLPNDQPGR